MVKYRLATPRYRPSAHAMNPSFPTEVWMRIFELATAVPGELDPTLPDPFTVPTPLQGRDLQRAICQRTSTKLSLIRVCHRWYTLALPCVYRTIVIRRTKTLAKLRDTLVASRSNYSCGDGTRVGYGWWTERLDLAMRDSQTWESWHSQFYSKAVEESLLAEIICHFPNLSILCVTAHFRGLGDLGACVVDALCNTCGPRLQSLQWAPPGRSYWGNSSLSPTPEDWNRLLAAAPNLIYVKGPRYLPDSPLSLPTHPYLSTLNFILMPYEAECCETKHFDRFPSLESVFFGVYGHDSIYPSPDPALLRTSGSHIRTVIINLGRTELQSYLDLIAKYCPQVTHLVLRLATSWRLLRDYHLPSSVTHLGLVSGSLHAKDGEYAFMFKQLSATEAPSLRVLRLLDWRDVQDLRRHPKVLHCGVSYLSKSKGWYLEDHEGKRMTAGY